MPTILRVARWLGAVIVAILVFGLAFEVGVWLWHHITHQTFLEPDWLVGFSSFWAILAGTLVVPRADWTKAALALWCLALAPPSYYLARFILFGHLSRANLVEPGSVLLAGVLVYGMARLAAYAKSPSV